MTINQDRFGLKFRDVAIAYLLLRVLIGVNYFNHGFTRIFSIPAFAEGIVKALENSYFPEFLVRINSYFVPPVELIVGILLTIGLFTRGALIATFILMIILKLGVTSVQNWDAATSMLSYGLVLFILLAGAGFNLYSIDHWRQRQQPNATEKPPEQGVMNFVRQIGRAVWPQRRRKRLSSSTTYRSY